VNMPSRAEYAGCETREQTGDLPAIWCDEVVVGARSPEEQALEPQTPQIGSHLAGGVFTRSDTEQIGNQQPRSRVVEAVDQVLKQGECQKQAIAPQPCATRPGLRCILRVQRHRCGISGPS